MVFTVAVALSLAISQVNAPGSATTPLAMSSANTRRFVAVHGRRSVAMGYPETGLEVWTYPLQIISGYQIGFRPEGSTTETDGRLLLRRVIENPDCVTRIYAGPNYIVREKLFVPLNQPAAILSYEVDSSLPISIAIHFTPVLNLMWPGAIGGQSVSWNSSLSGYLLEEPIHDLRAVVASPEIQTHDDVVNSTVNPQQTLSFSIGPRRLPGAPGDTPATASVYVSLLDSPKEGPASQVHAIEGSAAQWRSDAVAHYEELAQSSIRISTPDADVNAALAWSEIDLDQAWVCNPQLGCGIVGGYGPSRPGRRPQYAWFFAGDGLIDATALVDAGEYARARDELLFIEKYQDPKTGMIWHELSQSAGYIDWRKYPYMFVHVDISFVYLNVVAHYVIASGDVQFASAHWSSIDSAYHYCLSLLGPDGLPHIPSDKEGMDEQHRPAEDLGLSTSWVTASSSFAALAKAAGHPELAPAAMKQSQLARQAIAAHFWDAAHHFWINEYTATGAAIFTRRSGPADAIGQGIFSQQQTEELLNQLASSKFQTDWGTRGVATDSSIYDPWSYSSGSTFALLTADTATMFWMENRPDIAWSIWSGLVPLNRLDSLGHMHEVLAGNYYREQAESVPEQTWSSAGFLDSAIRGLLGLEVGGSQSTVTFRPNLPAQWSGASVGNIRLPHSTLEFKLKQDIDSVDLEITNSVAPATLLFEPSIPLGARVVSAVFDGRSVPVHVLRFDEAERGSVKVEVPAGSSRIRLRISGGVSLMLPKPEPHVGDPSLALKLTRVELQGRRLTIGADVKASGKNSFRLRTPWRIAAIQGASERSLGDNSYQIDIQPPPSSAAEYEPVSLQITFASQEPTRR